jgi:hypothetical protein
VTVLETMVALSIGLGVMAGALEASRLAVTRTALAKLDIEAAIRAERLMSGVGAERPLTIGQSEGTDGNGTMWVVNISRHGPETAAPGAFEVAATVTIKRGGLKARQHIAILKLVSRRTP